jgi:hypothetical protein
MTKQFVEYTGGPLYYNDNHFSDEEEMFDYYDDENVFEAELCDTKKIGCDLNVEDIIENIEARVLKRCDPEHDWKVAGLSELQEALERFKECQTQFMLVPNGKFVRLERPEEAT